MNVDTKVILRAFHLKQGDEIKKIRGNIDALHEHKVGFVGSTEILLLLNIYSNFFNKYVRL